MSACVLYGSKIHYWNYIRKPRRDHRLDPTQLFANADVFHHAIQDLAEPFVGKGVTKVAALDALSFILGGGVAYVLGAGLIHIRKEGKISWDVETQRFRDYSQADKTFEIASDAIQSGDTVLVVDDWSETGTQLKAAFKLIERLGRTRKARSSVIRIPPAPPVRLRVTCSKVHAWYRVQFEGRCLSRSTILRGLALT